MSVKLSGFDLGIRFNDIRVIELQSVSVVCFLLINELSRASKSYQVAF